MRSISEGRSTPRPGATAASPPEPPESTAPPTGFGAVSLNTLMSSRGYVPQGSEADHIVAPMEAEETAAGTSAAAGGGVVAGSMDQSNLHRQRGWDESSSDGGSEDNDDEEDPSRWGRYMFCHRATHDKQSQGVMNRSSISFVAVYTRC